MKRETVTKTYLGETFTYTTLVNDEGHVLWNNEIDLQFNTWLCELYQNQKELFKITFTITATNQAIINQLNGFLSYPEEADLINKLILTYFNSVENEISFIKNDNFEEMVFTKEAYFDPKSIQTIISLSNLSGLNPNVVVSEALNQICKLANTGKENLRLFWTKEILPQIIRR